MTRIFAKSDACLVHARQVFGNKQEDGEKTGPGVAHNGVPEQLAGNFGEQSNAQRPDWCANGRPWKESFRDFAAQYDFARCSPKECKRLHRSAQKAWYPWPDSNRHFKETRF